ncbi:MAG: hypothetical protein AB8G95_09825 [Anaerolineae bacterium]
MSSLIQELSNRVDLWALGVHLGELKKKLKLFTPMQVDGLIQKLASQMLENVPEKTLRSMRIIPIPRGGHFVAGQLAYRLSLKHDQFFDDGNSPVCIVDDCALTGKRFGQVLRRFDGREVWFCHLVSASELRKAILENEPNVKRCIAADDLTIRQKDLGEQMAAENRYLNASVEHVAFPWTEPGMPVTVPFSDEVEDGWRLLPPHLVLGNWTLLQIPPCNQTVELDIQSSSQVIWRVSADGILLYEESRQRLFAVSGFAAEIWRGCAGYQSQEMATKWLLANHPSASLEEIALLIAELVGKKLLIRL